MQQSIPAPGEQDHSQSHVPSDCNSGTDTTKHALNASEATVALAQRYLSAFLLLQGGRRSDCSAAANRGRHKLESRLHHPWEAFDSWCFGFLLFGSRWSSLAAVRAARFVATVIGLLATIAVLPLRLHFLLVRRVRSLGTSLSSSFYLSPPRLLDFLFRGDLIRRQV